MQLPSSFKEILEITTLCLGVLGAIMAMTKSGRMWFKNRYINFTKKMKEKNEIPMLLANILKKLETVDTRLVKVEKEVSNNSGSSMKDTIRLIRSEIEVTNWLSPRPTFRTTSSGINVFVNEAYCHLCGVTSDELLKFGWRNFGLDPDQVDDYHNRFKMSAKALSQFSGRLKLQTNGGEYRGEWMVKVRPLGPIDSNIPDAEIEYMWSGCLYPYDDIAKAYARQANIPAFV